MFDISKQVIAQIVRQVGSPCWIYDGDVVRRQIARLRAFDVIRYAQKANSNVHLLRLMREAGVVVDAVSNGEVDRALAAGFSPGGQPDGIVFTADLLDRDTLARVVQMGITVNAGSPQMLEQVGALSRGHRVWIRVNPGFGHGHSRKTNTGGEHSKHGIWHEDLGQAMRIVDRHGLRLAGLHMHIGSGVDYGHLKQVCDSMVAEVERCGRDLEAVSAGGGLSIPYDSGDPEIDIAQYFSHWSDARERIERRLGHPVQIEIEPGRFLVAQSGVLVSELRAEKRAGRNHFILVDAGFGDLMRPAMYGSHHRISILTPEGAPRSGPSRPTVVAGPLCESGDVFTQREGGEVIARELPFAEIGDLVVFHDAGAYGASMSSNYNSRPLVPEVLIQGGHPPRLIRRRQTMAELLALEDLA